jgi:hypothetical protein
VLGKFDQMSGCGSGLQGENKMSENQKVSPLPKDEGTVVKACIEHKHGKAYVEEFYQMKRDDSTPGDTLTVYYEENEPGLQEAPRCELYYEVFYDATIKYVVFEPPEVGVKELRE